MAKLNGSTINEILEVLGKIKTESIEIESQDTIPNLNADLLDGKEGSEYASATDVTNLTEQVNTNTGNILANMEDIKNNTEQIGTNKNNIAVLSETLVDVQNDSTKNASDINSLNTEVTSINTEVADLQTRTTTNETDISSLKTKTNTTNTNVSNLQSQVTTNSGNIKTNQDDIAALKTKTDTTNTNVANNTEKIEKILAGTAEIPSVENAVLAENANKLGGQLPAYYAKATDLSSYLPLIGGTITGKTIITGEAIAGNFMTRGVMGCSVDGTEEDVLYLNYNNEHPVYINNMNNVVYHSGNIPKASTSIQGIVKLNNTRTSTSTNEAATAGALKSAYDTINSTLTTHTSDTNVHLTNADRIILSKANKFKGYYETETALNNAHSTGESGDYAIVNTTDTVWIWDEDKDGGAGWKDGAGKGSVISVNNLTGEVVLTKSNIGLGNVDNTSDANKPISTAQQAALNLKLDKSGGVITGTLVVSSTIDATGNVTAPTFIGDLTGNADTATTLKTAKTINGTSFDGSSNITTTKWGEARDISIADSDATNTGIAVSVNGSDEVTLKLPATIKATLNGNASTATKLATGVTIGVSGITGTAQTFDGSKAITIPITAVPANLITGTVASATKAAQDGDGNVISTTYCIAHSGTEVPSNDLGKDGDIYILLEE